MDEPVARYFDKQLQLEAAKLLPGQYHAAADNAVIVTVLGSCVSACLWDPALRLGGMNHFLLPGAGQDGGDSARLGVYAMEVLINRLLKLGAEKRRLVAKVFGGASVLEGMEALNIGEQNGAFVLGFLREEEIPVAAKDLYGICPRKVYFFPETGRVLVKRLGELRNDTLQRRERDYLERLRPDGGDVEIFGRP